MCGLLEIRRSLELCAGKAMAHMSGMAAEGGWLPMLNHMALHPRTNAQHYLFSGCKEEREKVGE